MEQIILLDFGSQYTQVIARRIRECQVFSQILPFNTPAAKLAELKPKGLILSGGPCSVYEKKSPHCDPAIWKLNRGASRKQIPISISWTERPRNFGPPDELWVVK